MGFLTILSQFLGDRFITVALTLHNRTTTVVKEEALSVATTKLTRSPHKLMWSPCNVILFTPAPCHTGYSVSAWRGGGAAPPKPPQP